MFVKDPDSTNCNILAQGQPDTLLIDGKQDVGRPRTANPNLFHAPFIYISLKATQTVKVTVLANFGQSDEVYHTPRRCARTLQLFPHLIAPATDQKLPVFAKLQQYSFRLK
jgi:hypothetical protein